jgi:hypothetical protein
VPNLLDRLAMRALGVLPVTTPRPLPRFAPSPLLPAGATPRIVTAAPPPERQADHPADSPHALPPPLPHPVAHNPSPDPPAQNRLVPKPASHALKTYLGDRRSGRHG